MTLWIGNGAVLECSSQWQVTKANDRAVESAVQDQTVHMCSLILLYTSRE